MPATTLQTARFDIETDATGYTFLVAHDGAPYGVLDALEAAHVRPEDKPRRGERRQWALVRHTTDGEIVDVDRAL